LANYQPEEPILFKPSGSSAWLALNEAGVGALTEDAQKIEHLRLKLPENERQLSDFLQSALQLPHLAFFAGSGTSLGEVGGPSMHDLWCRCLYDVADPQDANENPDNYSQLAKDAINSINYQEVDQKNIEHLLSCCDAYLQVHEDANVADFVSTAKAEILDACSSFLDLETSDLAAYKMLLQRLARRRTRDPRLRVFTTNYDNCFEEAAASLGMLLVDGFSYTRRRRFDPKYFDYDFVRRDPEGSDFVEGVVALHKLHGSVTWARDGDDTIEASNPSPDQAVLIYPANGKYQQAFVQPHLEQLSRFLESLRKSNSCLMVAGFGFNDDHLAEPIVSAISSNPTMKLVVADLHAHDLAERGDHKYWSQLKALSDSGVDICLLNGSFKALASLVPNLAALTPAENLADAIRKLG